MCCEMSYLYIGLLTQLSYLTYVGFLNIGNNILPTKEVLAQRFSIQDTRCCLCKDLMESSIHLFVNCPVSWAMWFGNCYSIKVDNLNVRSCADILKKVLEPASLPNQSAITDKQPSQQISLHMAFTLEVIWNLRNQMIHNWGQVNLLSVIKKLDSRVLEHLNSMQASYQEQEAAHKNVAAQQNMLLTMFSRPSLQSSFELLNWLYQRTSLVLL